ncbi:hypothetical protein H5410_014607 [Solanum commersonii]|uniref:Putative plant transposon protein domain-containing protein n=1 Tax=Solanum commersonii TaxID=4109 RepID=A0A9J5ZRY3_SOLCO|nr:hypothetical protein H5410_014607 [Solanum commersonii]
MQDEEISPRQLRVGSASWRRGIILPNLIPFEAEDFVYVARRGGGMCSYFVLAILGQFEMSCHGLLVTRFLGSWEGCFMLSLSSHRPGKKVATSSNMKRVQSGNVPPTPALPRGQNRRFGVKAVTKEGKAWYKKHIETTYFSDICVDGDSLARINDILGTPQDTDPLVLTGLNIRPPYQAIRHMLCGPQSMAQWTKHNGKRYHKSLPYAHILRETHVWLKVVMNCLIPGLHYIDITRDRVCLVYALMTGMKLNIKAIIKSLMRKSRVHKGHRYAFGGLITKMCRVAGVLEENLDYMAPLYLAPVDITRTKGTNTDFGPTLTTAECHRRDEFIMAKMYGREMLRHKTGGRPSTDLEIRETENDIPTDEENLRTGSDVESDLDEEIDPIQVEAEADGGDIMED